jgi:hypothetical protein
MYKARPAPNAAAPVAAKPVYESYQAR